MKWEIFYSAESKRDLRKILDYISEDLHEPEIARNLVRRILGEIGKLDQMPNRHALYDEEPWRSQGLRSFPVKNYLVLYVTDEANHAVQIVRVVYGGMDIRKQLSETIL